MAVFTPFRMAVIDSLLRRKASSIQALANRLDKDYAEVQQAIQALQKYGVISVDESGCLIVPYTRIEVRR